MIEPTFMVILILKAGTMVRQNPFLEPAYTTFNTQNENLSSKLWLKFHQV